MDVGEVVYLTHSSKTKCVFVDNKELPLISIDIWCKAGSSFENVNKNGTAHFLEHMIFKGSNQIKPGEFDYKIESLGGISNASTGFDDVHYYVLIPPHNFKESLALLTNIVLSPRINKSDFIKEKNVVLDEVKQQNDQPDEKLFNYFLSRVWGDESYGQPILGTEKSIESLEIKDLENFHKNNYTNDKVCISIAGNISNNIYKLFEKSDLKYFTDLSKKGSPQPNLEKQKAKIGREEINFSCIEFSRLFMAWNIPSLKNQKTLIGLEILVSVLAVGRNSRLVKILKEEKDLVESIYAYINPGELGGILIIEACCDRKNLLQVEKTINKIIYDILNSQKITINELKKATNTVKSNYVFNLETSSQLSSFFGNELLWGRKNTMRKIENSCNYWYSVSNFKKITNFLNNDKYTLLASRD